MTVGKIKRWRVSRSTWIKAKLIVKDNRLVLCILLAWFGLGFLVYRAAYGLSVWDSFLASLFLETAEGNFTTAYSMWTQGIIFGVAFSMMFQNILEKYNPERSCRMLAKEMSGHVVVIGHSHLGRRLVAHFRERRVPYCLIEKDRERVDELLREGEPLVVDDAREMDALTDANIAEARAVLIASNNLETALLVTKRVRDRNKTCKIIARCYQDEFAEILETLGADEVISSSKNAFDDILNRIDA
jgi:hypothetical protein